MACRLLDFITHFLKAGPLEFIGIEEECCAAVTDLCAILDSTLVAVAVQRQVPNHGIVILFCLLNGDLYLFILSYYSDISL